MKVVNTTILVPIALVVSTASLCALWASGSDGQQLAAAAMRTRTVPSMCAARPSHLQLGRITGVNMPSQSSRTVRVNNFFEGLFGNPGATGAGNAQAMICIDCGFIYKKKRPTFSELPASYQCPACGVGKNRFKVYKEQGDYYNTLAAEKAAKRKTRSGPSSKRAELLRKQQEMQKEKDQQRGRGGWFGK